MVVVVHIDPYILPDLESASHLDHQDYMACISGLRDSSEDHCKIM